MNQFDKCLHLYIDCNTNKGRFIGIRKDILIIETEEQGVEEYSIQNLGNTLFLYLRQLNDLSEEQSKELVKQGLSIGRPYGYTFTNHAFVYLLSLGVDLFGLIHSGVAKDIKTLGESID